MVQNDAKTPFPSQELKYHAVQMGRSENVANTTRANRIAYRHGRRPILPMSALRSHTSSPPDSTLRPRTPATRSPLILSASSGLIVLSPDSQYRITKHCKVHGFSLSVFAAFPSPSAATRAAMRTSMSTFDSKNRSSFPRSFARWPITAASMLIPLCA
jgi:hypothetical protein